MMLLIRRRGKTWVWSIAYGRTRPHAHADYEPTRETAMEAFARSWNRE